MRPIIGSLATALICSACVWNEPEGQTGDLGRGVFYYECINTTDDPACDGTTTEPDFPAAIAIGGWFDMSFTRTHDDVGSLNVLAGSPVQVTTENGAMAIARSGYSALIAVTGSNKAVDIVHLYGQAVAGLELDLLTFDGWHYTKQKINRIAIEKGETIKIRAYVLDTMGRTLAGLLNYSYEVRDPSCVELSDALSYGAVDLTGLAPGQTVLIIEAGGFSKQYEISVTGGDTDSDTDTETELDAGPDAATAEVEP